MFATCPNCRREILIDPMIDGPAIRCDHCGRQFESPPPSPFDDFAALAPPPIGNFDFPNSAAQPPQAPAFYVPDKKSAGIAAVMSFLWPGLGQIYNGQIAKALIFMFVWPILLWGTVYAIAMHTRQIDPSASVLGVFVVGVLLWLSSLVWVIYDAYNEAERINTAHRRRYGQ